MSVQEDFKQIEGYTREDGCSYHVSRQGLVFYLKPDGQYQRVHGFKNKDNMMLVDLRKNDGSGHNRKRVHMLVARCFVPNPNSYRWVKHLDGDKTNNNFDNLKWLGRMPCKRKHQRQPVPHMFHLNCISNLFLVRAWIHKKYHTFYYK